MARMRPFKLAIPVLITALVVAVAVILWFGNGRLMPTAVDPVWAPIGMNCALLAHSAVFLGRIYCQATNWLGLATHLACAIHVVNGVRAAKQPSGTDCPRWPSPMLLDQKAQSPFGLEFRFQDLAVLAHGSREDWSRQTRNILLEKWPFIESDCEGFRNWQQRLVAEMRFASAVVSISAWCGILAPVFLLISMNVYPPVGERFVTTASVALIVAGFALVMYMALRIERNPLLSRMFTQHDDNLSFGGAVGALLPKLVAAIIILLPVLFPGFLEWIYSLLKSINSLQ